MGKKKKGNNGIKNEDTFKRMKFLYQASHLALISGNTTLSTFYGYNMMKIASKNVLRMYETK